MPQRPALLITAGPTHEPIDAVRYIANRSSGRMGLALARAAVESGWDVTLLLGPVAGDPDIPEAVEVHRYESTADLATLLDSHFDKCDALVMAAAVADYRPAPGPGSRTDTKLQRGEKFSLELEPTPDLVAACAERARPDQRVIGFALESAEQLPERAPRKLARKGLFAIVANPLETIDSDTIDAVVTTSVGESHQPGPMPKSDFARWLVGWIASTR